MVTDTPLLGVFVTAAFLMVNWLLLRQGQQSKNFLWLSTVVSSLVGTLPLAFETTQALMTSSSDAGPSGLLSGSLLRGLTLISLAPHVRDFWHHQRGKAPEMAVREAVFVFTLFDLLLLTILRKESERTETTKKQRKERLLRNLKRLEKQLQEQSREDPP